MSMLLPSHLGLSYNNKASIDKNFYSLKVYQCEYREQFGDISSFKRDWKIKQDFVGIESTDSRL